MYCLLSLVIYAYQKEYKTQHLLCTHTDRQTDRHTNSYRQTDTHTETDIHTETDRHTHTHMQTDQSLS